MNAEFTPLGLFREGLVTLSQKLAGNGENNSPKSRGVDTLIDKLDRTADTDFEKLNSYFSGKVPRDDGRRIALVKTSPIKDNFGRSTAAR